MADYQRAPYHVPALYVTDKSGFLYDIRDLNFDLLEDPEVQEILAQIDTARKQLSKQRENANRYRRVCNNLSSLRNSSDYERLFRIRYQKDSAEPVVLRKFLSELPLGAFLRVIFKISFAELVGIADHLPDFARYIGAPAVSKKRANLRKLAHLPEWLLFVTELEGLDEGEIQVPFLPPPPETEPRGFIFSLPSQEPSFVVNQYGMSVGPAPKLPENNATNHTVSFLPVNNPDVPQDGGTKVTGFFENLKGRSILGFLSRYLVPLESVIMSKEETHGVISLESDPGPPTWEPRTIRIQLSSDISNALVRYAASRDKGKKGKNELSVLEQVAQQGLNLIP